MPSNAAETENELCFMKCGLADISVTNALPWLSILKSIRENPRRPRMRQTSSAVSRNAVIVSAVVSSMNG